MNFLQDVFLARYHSWRQVDMPYIITAFRYDIISYLARKTSCKKFIVNSFYRFQKSCCVLDVLAVSCSLLLCPCSVLAFGVDGDVSMFCLLYLWWRHLLKPFSNSYLFLSTQTQPPSLSVQLENAVTCFATLGHKYLRKQLKQSKDTARTEQEHSTSKGAASTLGGGCGNFRLWKWIVTQIKHSREGKGRPFVVPWSTHRSTGNIIPHVQLLESNTLRFDARRGKVRLTRVWLEQHKFLT